MRLTPSDRDQILTEGTKEELIKLIGFITYKNSYPSDFALLQKGQGFLFTLIRYLSQEARANDSSSIREKITQLVEQLNLADNEFLYFEKDLNCLYFSEYIQKHKSKTFTNQSTSQIYDLQSIKEKNVFEKFIEEKRVLNEVNAQINVNFSDIEKSVHPSLTYKQRLKIIKNKSVKKRKYIEQEIVRLESRLLDIQSAPISEFINDPIVETWVQEHLGNHENTNEFWISDRGTQFGLTKFLILNKLVDSHYHIYISAFHSGSMTTYDREYMRALAADTPKSIAHPLDNPSMILDESAETDFQKPAILNVNLIDCLVLSSSKYKGKISSFFRYMQKGGEEIDRFIILYFKKGGEIERMLEALSSEWPEFWKYCYGRRNFPYNGDPVFTRLNLERLLGTLLSKCSTSCLIEFNSDNKLTEATNSLESFPPDGFEFSTEKTEEILTKLNIKFSNMEGLINNEELYTIIHEGNHYVLNLHMCYEVVKVLAGGNFENIKCQFDTGFITALRTHFQDSFLCKYIHANMANFISDVWCNLPEKQEESEEVVLDLLNDEILSELVPEILEKLDSRIENIRDVNKLSLWELVFSTENVEPNWDNIAAQYEASENQLDEFVVEFLNRPENYNQFENDAKTQIPDDALRTSLFKSLISSDRLTDESFFELAPKIPFYYDKGLTALEEISSGKVEALINNNTIRISSEIISNLSVRKDDCIISFLEYQIKNLISKLDELDLDHDLYTRLIDSGKVSTDEKEILIESISDTDNSDLLAAIFDFCIESRFNSENVEIVKKLVALPEKQVSDKVNIVNSTFSSLDKNSIGQCLDSIAGAFSDIGVPHQKPSIPDNPENLELAQNLEKVGYISSIARKSIQKKIKLNSFNDGPRGPIS